MNIFDNFKLLKKDMEDNGWVIDAFPFSYKNIDYVVLVKLYQKDEVKENLYALLKLEFLKVQNINDNLIVPVNSRKLLIDTMTLKKYFGIEWSANIGDIKDQFSKYFSQFIPNKITLSKNRILKIAMIKSLSESDSEDPRKIYCYSVRRNSGKGTRTIFNDNKTRLLRPTLYQKFMNDNTVSFCYSSTQGREKNDGEIIINFTKNRTTN